MQVEQSIQRAILDYLRFRGIPAIKITTTGIYVRSRDTYIKNPSKGALDIYACLPPNGRSCWIEVKKPGGRVSPEQQQFIDIINQAGGLAFVAHSVEEVEQNLNAYWRTDNHQLLKRGIKAA
jgi:hypothetical protein